MPRSFLLAWTFAAALAVLPALSAQDQAADLAAANARINNGDYPGAAEAFAKFVQDYPTSISIADAQLKLAYSNLILGRFDEATALYRKLLAPPSPPEAVEMASGLLPQALFGKASALPEEDPARLGLFKETAALFEKFLAQFPGNDLVENNRYTLAWCYFQTQQIDLSIAALRKNLADFASSETIPDSEYLLSLMLATKANLALNQSRTATAGAFPFYEEAQRLLEGIISKRTDLPLISDAQFQLGEVLFNRAIFSTGNDRPRLLQLALAAYRSVDPADVVIREQQQKIDALRARTTATLVSKNARAIQKLQNQIGRETARLASLKSKASQQMPVRLKMAQIFYQLSTPALPRYDETRTLLDYLEPFAADSPTADADKKTILYYRTMTYALQGNVAKAEAGYAAFFAAYPADHIAENLPLALGAMLVAATPPDPAKALGYLQQQIELYPKSEASSAATSEQARAFSQLQRFDEAIRTYQEFLAAKPEKSQAARATAGLAEVYRNTGKLDDADALYAKIQSDFATETALAREASFWRGYILVQQQRFPDAVKALAGFLALHPDDPQLTPNAFFTLAQAQRGAGAADTALQTFKTLVAKFPKSEAATFTYFQRYDLAKEKNDVPAMDAAMREFIAAYPADGKLLNAYTNLAQNLLGQGKPDDAIRVYYEFVDKNPAHPLVPSVLLQTASQWANIAQTLGRYAGLTDPDRATWRKALENSIADGERLLQKAPESPEAANAARAILVAQKEFIAAQLKTPADVEANFTQLAARFSQAPAARSKILFTLASFLYESDPARALAQMSAAYDPALVYAPGDLDLYGSALLGQKKTDEAQAVYEKLAADYPNPPGNEPAPLAVQEAQAISLFGLGEILRARGDNAAAAQNFARLKELYPWSPKIFQANYGIALNLYAEKKYPEAIALVEGIVRAPTASNELRAQAMILGGKIRRATGDLAAAIDYFIKTEYFYGGVPQSAAEGLFLGAQTLEAQSAAAKDPKLKAEAAVKAKKYYQDLRQKYPATSFAAQAKGKA